MHFWWNSASSIGSLAPMIRVYPDGFAKGVRLLAVIHARITGRSSKWLYAPSIASTTIHSLSSLDPPRPIHAPHVLNIKDLDETLSFPFLSQLYKLSHIIPVVEIFASGDTTEPECANVVI